MEQTAAEILERVPSYLEQERYEEAERLLIAVLRQANDGSAEHGAGLVFLGELYEREERFREGLIVCRDLAEQVLGDETELGGRVRALMGRLHMAVGETTEAGRYTES